MSESVDRRTAAMSALAEILRLKAPLEEEKRLGGLEWRAAIATAITNALQATAEEIAKQKADEAVREFFIAVFEATTTSLMGAIAGPIFKLVFKTKDRSEEKLDTLLGEPFQTGIRVGKECLVLEAQRSATNPDRLRDGLFISAITTLNTAYTHATHAYKSDSFVVFYIRLFQGILASAFPSSIQAKQYFADCKELIDRQKEKLESNEKAQMDLSHVLEERAARYERLLKEQPEIYNGAYGMFPIRTHELEKEPIPLHLSKISALRDYPFLDPPVVLRAEAKYFAGRANDWRVKIHTYESLLLCMEEPVREFGLLENPRLLDDGAA